MDNDGLGRAEEEVEDAMEAADRWDPWVVSGWLCLQEGVGIEHPSCSWRS